MPEGRRTQLHADRGAGEAQERSSGRPRGRRGGTDPRRLRLHRGVPRMPLLSRRQDPDDRGRHRRDAGARDRSRAWGMNVGPTRVIAGPVRVSNPGVGRHAELDNACLVDQGEAGYPAGDTLSDLPGNRTPGVPRSGARRGRFALALALVVALLASPAPAASAGSSSPRPRTARLEGFFRLSGRITEAADVGRERTGEVVQRTWAFLPMCTAGACGRVELVRLRHDGRDMLILHRVAPAFYVGRGSFYAPLRCGSRTYPRGESVPFSVGVRVTAAIRFGTTVLASRLRASYTNRSRSNLTPCVAFPGHDAAVYRGHLLLPPAPTRAAPA